MALRILETLGEWNDGLPVVLLARVSDTAERRARLAALAALALRRTVDDVAVAQGAGRAPEIMVPDDAGLYLSSASRGGLAALGVARCWIGVDVEFIEPREPPWNVLHPDEAAALRREADPSIAFAALWTVKEAYLKALGTGLSREPAGFAVRLGSPVTIDDPGGPAAQVTLLRRDEAFIAVVLLADEAA